MAQASQPAPNQLAAPKNVEEKVSFSKLKAIDKNTLHSDAIRTAWKAVRDVIALRLMGERGCAVPYLEEASKYGLLNVLVKERKRLTEKLTRKPSSIHWSAPLENILPTYVNLQQFRNENRVEILDKDSADALGFHLKNTERPNDKGKPFVKCDIRVNLYGLQHYQINSDKQEIYVDLHKHFQGLDHLDRIYLITEVYVVRSLVMSVSVGDNKYQWNSTKMMPVGFVFKKCELASNGLLKYGLEVERKKAIEYNWVTENSEDNQVKQVTNEKLVKTGKK